MAYNINNVVIEGEIYNEVKVLSEKEGEPQITSVTILHKKMSGSKEIVSWIDIKGYGKLAGILLGLVKGDHVLVYGHLHQERWKSKGVSQARVVIEPYKILLVENANCTTIDDNEGNDSTDAQDDEPLGF